MDTLPQGIKNRGQENSLLGDAIIELGFVCLPLLILMIVTSIPANRATPESPLFRVLTSEEWSFAAVVLLGQGVIKAYRMNASISIVALALFGVILAVVINVIILLTQPSLQQDIVQIFLFAASVVSFIWISTSNKIGNRALHAEMNR